MNVRPLTHDDASAWREMRCALWPDEAEGEHEREIAQFLAGTCPRMPWAVFVAGDTGGGLLGFAELSIRPYAEGCRTTRVGYLEGWYVRPEARGQGIGRALVTAGQAWARAEGCVEFASDADPANEVSVEAHRGLGFDDVGLVRCFRMDLT